MEDTLELFCGPGGMGLGFSNYFRVVHAIDEKAEACATYRANHPETTVQERDVRNVSGARGDYFGITGVIGGPPCQAFSKLNHRRKADDPRVGLVLEFMRLVEEIRPRFFVLENVPTTPQPIKDDAQRIGKALGYFTDSLYLNAADYGAAQTRKRWVLVGQRDKPFHLVEPSFPKTVRAAFSGLIGNWGLMKCREGTLERLSHVNKGHWEATTSGGFKSAIKLSWEKPSPAVVNLKKVYMIHPSENRNISLAEAAALQGFPPSYVWKGTGVQIAQMIANAMPAELATQIARSVAA